MAEKPAVGLDVETYRNLFYIGLKRFHDGKRLGFEFSSRSPSFDRHRLETILKNHRVITYNGLSYDMPMVWYALTGVTNEQLKLLSDRIIGGGMRSWEVERELGMTFPAIDHVDLMEVQPNAFASLKTLNGRLHGKRMQDLPYAHDQVLTHAEMDAIIAYNGNDLDATEIVYEALKEPIAMREVFSASLRMDVRSKSDSQLGEAIVKRRVEQMTGKRMFREDVSLGGTFRYKIPPFVRFHRPELQAIVERLRTHDFIVQANGKVALPKWLEEAEITIGSSTYALGIGGLHSTESNRAVHSDDNHVLIDADVASQYPAIILKLGLYPKALGPEFLDAYAAIKRERLEAKKAKDKVKDKGLKIALNGCYGKLGSPYSILYAPHLMVAVTLTGQLTLLMLIERAERAGISVVSGNTDGVLFLCPRERANPIGPDSRLQLWPDDEDIPFGLTLKEITDQWEQETGFDLEFAEYRSIYNASVNSYFAVKADGKGKVKGPFHNPWHTDYFDLREQMMKNPQMTVCADAVRAFIQHGTPLEETIRACRDIRSFVTVVKADGGATWRDEYLGKVIRYAWGRDGEAIYKVKGHARTGVRPKVPKTDGAIPMMELPDEFPEHIIDYDRYIVEALEILRDIGALDRPPPPIKIREVAAHRPLWAWALAA